MEEGRRKRGIRGGGLSARREEKELNKKEGKTLLVGYWVFYKLCFPVVTSFLSPQFIGLKSIWFG